MTRTPIALAAITAALLGPLACGPAIAATPSPAPSPSVSAAATGNVDADHAASLTIHKGVWPATTPVQTYTARADGPTDYMPVSGVQFTVQRLTSIDLTTQAGWEQARAASEGGTDGLALGAPITLTTDETGTATVSLPVGAYVVTETDAPASVVRPFAAQTVVTLPAPGDSGWDYDASIWPRKRPAP